MSEYGDYSQKIFDEMQRNSFQSSSQYQAEYIDFNQHFSFNQAKIQNIQDQLLHSQSKSDFKDTDCTIRPVQPQLNKFQEERKVRIIETSSSNQNSYLKCKKGSAYQTMDLNINFKTIFCRIIRDLFVLKLLTKGQKQLFLKYRGQSPSFKSLIIFLNSRQNLVSKQKIVQLMESSKILKKILYSQVEIKNRISMLKFIKIMRKAVMNKQINQKWKNNC